MVVHKLCDALYRIQRSSRTHPKIVHFNRLKRYRGKALESWIPLTDPQVEIECEAPARNEVAANRPTAEIIDSDSEEEIVKVVLPQDLEENEEFSLPDRTLNVSPMKTNVQSQDSSSFPKVSEPIIRRHSKKIVRQPKRLIEEI